MILALVLDFLNWLCYRIANGPVIASTGTLTVSLASGKLSALEQQPKHANVMAKVRSVVANAFSGANLQPALA